MKIRNHLFFLLLVLISGLAIAACGGDDGPIVLPPTEEGGEDAEEGGDVGDETPFDVQEDTADTIDELDGEEGGIDADAVEPPDGGTEEGGETVEPDCESDEDCEDVASNACEVGICNEDSECEAVASEVEECCLTDVDCDDTDPNTDDTCPVEGESCVHDLIQVGCQTDADCAAELITDACHEAVCQANGLCTIIEKQIDGKDCCLSAADCDDGNSLTIDTCPAPGSACDHVTDSTACADNIVFLSSNFDDGTAQGWNVFDYQGDPAVTWHVSPRRSHSGNFSFYFGRSDCPTYYSGALDDDCALVGAIEDNSPAKYVSLESPPLNLQGDSVILLSFRAYVDMEWLYPLEAEIPFCSEMAPGTAEPLVNCIDDEFEEFYADNIIVYANYTEEVSPGNFVEQTERVWWAADVKKDSGGVFLHIGADLSSYADKVISLEFVARADENYNLFEGAFIDSVVVKTGCDGTKPGGGSNLNCEESGCSDANPCVIAECTPLVNTGSSACFNFLESGCSPCLTGQDFECDDFDECTVEFCADNQCSYSPDIACCEDSPSNGPYDFEDGELPAGWEVSGGDGNVSWHVTSLEAATGDFHLYFGDPEEGTYCVPDPLEPDECKEVHGSVTTSFIQLGDDGGHLLGSMDLLLATEWLNADPNSPEFAAFPFDLDKFTVEVLYNDNGAEYAEVVFDSFDIGGATGVDEAPASYLPVNFDLTPFAGEAVRLRFSFATGDDLANEYGGVLVDNFGIYNVCQTPECILPGECADASYCTADFCILGQCENLKEDPLCCAFDDFGQDLNDCDDDNGCTVEYCDPLLNQCVSSIPDPNCCEPSAEDLDDFETPITATDWFFDNTDSEVFWGFVEDAAGESNSYEGSGYLYFGNPDTGSYYDEDGVVFGSAYSPLLEVSTQGLPVVRFMLNLSTEWDNKPYQPSELCIDCLTVYVQPEGGFPVEMWNSSLIGGTTAGEYELVEIGLGAFAGENVQIIFDFATDFEGLNNDYAGVKIDNFTSEVVCGDLECFSAFECEDDADSCSVPACVANQCGFDQKDTPECCIEHLEDETKFENGTNPDDGGYTLSSYSCGENSGYNPISPSYEPGDAGCVADEEAAALWQLSAGQSKSGAFSLHFGNINEGTFADGSNAVAGYALSPPYALYAGKTASLNAWVFVDVEVFNEIFTNDVFRILAVDDSGNETVVWDKGQLEPNTQYGTWVPISADLSDLNGEVLRIKFYFDSYDGIENDNGEGIYVDDIQVIQECDDI